MSKYLYNTSILRLMNRFPSVRKFLCRVLCSVFLSSVSFGSNTAIASDVVADYNASIQQQAIILPTSSGAIQVNMRTPTAAGVSVSQFSRFNVDNKGVILANNRKAAKTKTAGWVSANPYMARGEADVLVNQVNSNSPSQLNGVIEVAGKRADVVIANPSGISVNGGTFLNANKTILSTGNPIVRNGKLTGHNIKQGKITITGKGLDVKDGNYTALLARSAEINANILKGNGTLDIITGVNTVDAKGNVTSSNANPRDGKKLNFAIDTGKLGGMYANSIRLVATERGVGINNAGIIQAHTLTLTADGKLKNSGQLKFDTLNTDIQKFDNDGAIVSSKPIDLNLKRLHNKGTIKSQQKLSIKAKKELNNRGKLLSNTSIDIKSDSVTNTGTIKSNKTLQIATKKLDNSGNLTSGGSQTITSDSVNNTGAITSADKVSIDSKVDVNNTGVIVAEKSLTIDSKSIANDGDITSGGKQVLQADTIDNNGNIQSADNVTLNAKGNVTNNGKIVSQKDLILNSEGLANEGNLVSGDNQIITAEWINNAGDIQSSGSLVVKAISYFKNSGNFITGNLTVKVTDDMANRKNGKIITDKSLTLNSKNVANNGDIVSGGNQTITTGKVDNKITSGETLTLNSKNISNAGDIVSSGNQIITTGKVDNSGSIQSSQDLTIKAADNLTNTKGSKVTSGKILTLNSKNVANNGDIVSDGKQAITTGKVDNAGNIQSTGSLTIKANDDLTNTKGSKITSGKVLIINSKSIANDGDITSGGNQTITTNKVDNAGSIQSSQDLTIKATDDLANAKDSKITSGKELILNSKNVSNNGDIVSGGNQAISTGKVDNAGNIQSTGSLTVKATDNLINTKGNKITSGEILTLNSKNVANNGDIVSGGNQTITTEKVDNNGNIQSSQDLTIKATNNLNNTKGSKVTSGKDLSLKTKNVANNGDIVSDGKQTITTGKVDNAGNIKSTDDLTIKATNDVINGEAGKIVTAKSLTLDSKNVANNGDIVSNGDQTITTGKVDNNGSIQSSQDLTISATDDLDNTKGSKITSGQTLTLDSKNIANNGDIVSGSNQTITTGKVENRANIKSLGDLTVKALGYLKNSALLKKHLA